jgi:protein-S-isoprenylcysteine O-methyltransferase Ste14
MQIPGFSEFKAHLPDFTDRQAKLVVARLGIVSIVSLSIAFLLDNLMRLLYLIDPSNIFMILEPLIPIILPMILILGGILLAQIGFFRKNRLIEKYNVRAYQKVVKYIFTGIPMVFGGIFYAYIPHALSFFGMHPINSLTTQLSTSLFYLFFGVSWEMFPRIIIGLVILLLMIGTMARSVRDFGIDNAGLVYVYYPEDARVIQNDIYSIVRHPMYMALIFISVGGFIFQFTIYSIIHVFITIVFFSYHIFIVEERELNRRLGDSYKEYKAKVPAILIKPKNWLRFFKFIIGR